MNASLTNIDKYFVWKNRSISLDDRKARKKYRYSVTWSYSKKYYIGQRFLVLRLDTTNDLVLSVLALALHIKNLVLLWVSVVCLSLVLGDWDGDRHVQRLFRYELLSSPPPPVPTDLGHGGQSQQRSAFHHHFSL